MLAGFVVLVQITQTRTLCARVIILLGFSCQHKQFVDGASQVSGTLVLCIKSFFKHACTAI